MNAETPCQCQKCGWLGPLKDALESQPGNALTLNICPRCSDETEVQNLGQKGLDGLRNEYRLLSKVNYQQHLTQSEKSERQCYLERFFEHIGQSLKVTSTYFGVPVIKGKFVRESDISKLPFYEFWGDSRIGSSCIRDGNDTLIYLHDWEAFSLLFIRTGKHRNGG